MTLAQPLGVVADGRLLWVQDAESLFGIGLGVGLDLLGGQLRSQSILIRGITDQRGEITDQEGDLVSELLELAQLAHRDGMTEMQVARSRVKPGIDTQRAFFLFSLDQALGELLGHGGFEFVVAVLRALHQEFDLLFNVHMSPL